jgi:hypothetical protein
MRITQALGLPVYRLPSTSPANASWSFERKLAAWREAFVAAGLVDDDGPTQVAERTREGVGQATEGGTPA